MLTYMYVCTCIWLYLADVHEHDYIIKHCKAFVTFRRKYEIKQSCPIQRQWSNEILQLNHDDFELKRMTQTHVDRSGIKMFGSSVFYYVTSPNLKSESLGTTLNIFR